MLKTKTTAIAIVSACLLTGFAAAQSQGAFLTIPNFFQSGTPALASQVNDNFTAVADAVNANRADIDANTAATLSPANTLTVSPSGAEFTSIAAALDSITENTEDNPFMVLVYPGVYEETSVLQVKPFVHLKGMSRSGVVVNVNRSSTQQSDEAAVVRLEDLGRISDMTLFNGGDSSTFAIGILGDQLSDNTTVERVDVTVDGNGGTGHFAMLVRDSDLRVRHSKLVSSGATTVNSAFGSTDSGGTFAQPLVENCELQGLGVNTGFGMQMTSTAATVTDCHVRGFFRAVSGGINGITTIRNCKIQTLGLNPAYEATGSASILSGNTFFISGNPVGLASRFKYVHCIKSNFNPVVNGTGSTVTP